MKISIIGTGKMGRWFAENIFSNFELAVFDQRENRSINHPRVTYLNSLSELSEYKPDLLLNAVTLKHTINLFKEVENYLKSNCIIIDIASIKGDLEKYYVNCPFPFVSLHPMFGPGFSKLDSLQNESIIYIRESDEQGKKIIRDLFERFQINHFEIAFSEHDILMSYSLTLPFTSSIVFMACLQPKGLLPGTTFKKHRKIAATLLQEDNTLLTEILFNPYSVQQIHKICSNLEYLKHIIKDRDYEETVLFLNKLRKKLPGWDKLSV